MAVFPFTKDGAALKLSELYALTDAALTMEAKKISADLAGWLKENFTFTIAQTDYLDSLPSQVLTSWGGLLAGAVTGRGPVIMNEPQNYGPSRRTKKTIWEIGGSSDYTPPTTGIGTLNSSISVTIRYEFVD